MTIASDAGQSILRSGSLVVGSYVLNPPHLSVILAILFTQISRKDSA